MRYRSLTYVSRSTYTAITLKHQLLYNIEVVIACRHVGTARVCVDSRKRYDIVNYHSTKPLLL